MAQSNTSTDREINTQVNVRVPPDLLKQIDKFRSNEPDVPTRPEAIRRLMEKGLQQPPSKG